MTRLDRTLVASLVVLLAGPAACDKDKDKGDEPAVAKQQDDEKAEPSVAPEPPAERSGAAAPQPPPGYPDGFPLLADGVRDPGYPPDARPGSPTDFLYVFSARSPLEVGEEITSAAKPGGWACTAMSDPGAWVCIKGVKQLSISAKTHPQGGTALFVSELPDIPSP